MKQIIDAIFKPDPQTDEAYMDCNCQSNNEYNQRLNEIWNNDLLTAQVRICNNCGNTNLTWRVKDERNTWKCSSCHPNPPVEFAD